MLVEKFIMKAHETWAFGFGRRRFYDQRIIATTTSIIGAGDCGRLRSCHHLADLSPP